MGISGIFGSCSPASVSEAEQLEVMFRAAIDQVAPAPPQKAICFGIESGTGRLEDPPQHLLRRWPDVLGLPTYPASSCSFDIFPFVTATGEQAMLYTVKIERRESGGAALFWATATYGNLGAEGRQFKLKRKGGKWIVEPTGLRVMS